MPAACRERSAKPQKTSWEPKWKSPVRAGRMPGYMRSTRWRICVRQVPSMPRFCAGRSTTGSSPTFAYAELMKPLPLYADIMPRSASICIRYQPVARHSGSVCLVVKDRLNIDAMKEAAASFLGRHDFSPYRDNRDKAGDGTGSIVEVTDVELGAYADLILFRIGVAFPLENGPAHHRRPC